MLKLYRRLILAFLLLALVASNANYVLAQDDGLLETGKATKIIPIADKVDQFKIISYNIRWRSGKELAEIIQLFRNDPEIGNALVLGLQEVDRNKKRSKFTNSAKLIADELGMHYAWAAPPAAKSGNEEETGVALLSVFPLADVRRLVLPHSGPGNRRRAAIGATINVGGRPLRVYSVHSETRIPTNKKIEQFQAVLNDLSQFPAAMPAIVVGDLNTWEPGAGDKTEKLFQDAKFHTPFNNDSTFCRRLLFYDLKLKLDWVWLRGVKAESHGIDRKIGISDHWPLWTVVRLENPVEPVKDVTKPGP